ATAASTPLRPDRRQGARPGADAPVGPRGATRDQRAAAAARHRARRGAGPGLVGAGGRQHARPPGRPCRVPRLGGRLGRDRGGAPARLPRRRDPRGAALPRLRRRRRRRRRREV
ncbi:MAG: Heat shock protein 60 family co-chaperone GroES, partial [uncultured Solirubrobacteraceae bacterium]